MRSYSTIAMTIVAVALAACGRSASDGPLTIYSGRSEELVAPLLEQFTEATSIDVEIRYGDSAELALLIEQEGDRSPADVFISQSPGATGFLAENEALEPISDGVLDRVDPAFRNGEGEWVGISGRVRVLVYNTDLVDPAELPSSIYDLTDERFAGQVAVAPANGSFQDFVTAMRDVDGDERALEWLTGMAENESPEYANNSAIVQAVGRGEVPMGLVNHYYNFRALDEDPGLASANHYFPSGDIGGLVIVTAAAIIEGTDQPDQANEFLTYLLDPEAQQFLTTETFEYPLASGAEPWQELPALDEIVGFSYDFDELGGGLERTTEMIETSGLEGP